jgi:hypothetical protein
MAEVWNSAHVFWRSRTVRTARVLSGRMDSGAMAAPIFIVTESETAAIVVAKTAFFI